MKMNLVILNVVKEDLDQQINKIRMGFFTNIVSATIKTALTPVAVVKDAVNIVTGEDADATKNLLSSAAEDATDAFDEITGG